MKSFSLLTAGILSCLLFLLSSCQKELSFENNTVPVNGATAAAYTLAGAGSTCTGTVLAGTYMSGMAMTAANTATIQVLVTSTGTYSITTATVNGVSFTASGSFTSTGTQTVTLVGSGTPAAAGAKTFAVASGSASCSFDITFAAAVPPAVFTFAGTPGACSFPIATGVYMVNSVLTPANTITIKVNITTAGSYNIVTNIVNGISFSAAGVFTTTGTNTPVTLFGAGTPLAAGTTTLKPDGAATCSFDIPVTAAVVPAIYSCKIDGAAATFNEQALATTVDPFGVTYLYLNGYKTASRNEQMEIFITNNDGSSVAAGTYNENSALTANGYRIEIDLHLLNADMSTTIWNTSSTLLPPANPAFTIVVTSITATRVKGTFSGKLTNTLEGGTAFKTITEGVFDLPK